MEIIAQRGLPVVPQNQQQAKLMTGESKPEVSAPLTSGFARTGYEQDQQRSEAGATVKGISVEKAGSK
jgi:hypothetical protein